MEDITRNYVQAADRVYYLEEVDNETRNARYFNGVSYQDNVPRIFRKVAPDAVPADRKADLDKSRGTATTTLDKTKSQAKKKTKVDPPSI